MSIASFRLIKRIENCDWSAGRSLKRVEAFVVPREPGRMRLAVSQETQFSEINLRNSRFRFEQNPVRFDAGHRRVLVFFAVNRFEVVSERD